MAIDDNGKWVYVDASSDKTKFRVWKTPSFDKSMAEKA